MRDHHSAALKLSIFTVGYNACEGVISVVFAVIAGSPALLGFGVDSFVESMSGMIMIWRFSRISDLSVELEERREKMAIRLVGISLLILAFYVIYESCEALYFSRSPQRNPVGIVIAIVSLVVMPILFFAKRRVAGALQSRSLAADAKQTLACVLLSIALLIGSGLHYIMGVWQADPVAGLAIAGFLIREGYKAWTQQDLCCSC
jgi:divalent metal cation (Fe/Co/Zn/Cd) transporter